MDTTTVNWDFVVLFGTILFWTLMHYFSPDGRQWRSERLQQPTPPTDATPVLAKSPAPRQRR